MITTIRSESKNSTFTLDKSRERVAVLERTAPKSYATYNQQEVRTRTSEEERERMKSNLDKLLNYDRYAELEKKEREEAIRLAEEKASATIEQTKVDTATDEDLMPSSTTMQFTTTDVEEMMTDTDSKTEENVNYKLNKKGKLAIVLFAIVTTLIMTLIIINSAVLANLNYVSAQKESALNSAIVKYEQLLAEKEAISDPDYIANVAENTYNMIKR